MERFVAIDNVCAWPNLTLMPDGTIIATIFNQPCHGTWEGDVECWASSDGGRLWEWWGTPAPHEPETNRMNVAAGLLNDGTLMVLASGWGGANFRGHVLPVWVCRSLDGGRTWSQREIVASPAEASKLVPFGDIIPLPDGSLAAPFYGGKLGGGLCSSYLLFSRDGGDSWGEPAVIGPANFSETSVLRLRADRWLAAVRSEAGGPLELALSQDEGRTWSAQGPLAWPNQHPADLYRLADGRVLVVYGIRNRGLYGVGARLSADEGESWGAPMLLVNLEDATDGGYPASVQVADGTVVTAYYCNHIPPHQRYHMGVLRWQIEGE